MSVTLDALLSLGITATLIGDDPANEVEYFERIKEPSATLPRWATVHARMLELQAAKDANAYVEKRATAYTEAYDKVNGTDAARAMGFVIDDLLEAMKANIAAGKLDPTPELSDILAKRDKVKSGHPKKWRL